MLTARISWLAGFLEGEGSFLLAGGHSARIEVSSTDKDIIERAAVIFGGCRVCGPYWARKSTKHFWKLSISGMCAASWMMTLYPLMGLRRRAKIHEVLAVWRVQRGHPKNRQTCPQGHPLSGDNLVVYAGARVCRECHRRRSEDFRSRRLESRVADGQKR